MCHRRSAKSTGFHAAPPQSSSVILARPSDGAHTLLVSEHRDLDMAIEALEHMVAGDQLQIQRLKKRKLALKDRISHLEDQITPDIIA